MSLPIEKFKIVLLGEGRVGKTSVVVRYCKNEFDSERESTKQAHYLEKTLNFAEMKTRLEIWDTAGQERFRSLGPLYYRDAHGALLVYDVTDASSWEKVKDWIKELKTMRGDQVQLMIIGNKSDLKRNSNISIETVTSYANSIGAKHISTSAKTGSNIDDAFLGLTQSMINKRKGNNSSNNNNNNNNNNNGNNNNNNKDSNLLTSKNSHNTLIIDDSNTSNHQSAGGGCC